MLFSEYSFDGSDGGERLGSLLCSGCDGVDVPLLLSVGWVGERVGAVASGVNVVNMRGLVSE